MRVRISGGEEDTAVWDSGDGSVKIWAFADLTRLIMSSLKGKAIIVTVLEWRWERIMGSLEQMHYQITGSGGWSTVGTIFLLHIWSTRSEFPSFSSTLLSFFAPFFYFCPQLVVTLPNLFSDQPSLRLLIVISLLSYWPPTLIEQFMAVLEYELVVVAEDFGGDPFVFELFL